MTSFLRRSCSFEKFNVEISILNTLIFCQVLKNVRKVSVSICVIVYYKEFCEGCESKKVKIPITYARARKRAREENYDKKANCKRMQMEQISLTMVTKRFRRNSKKSPTFFEKRGRFSKFRGRFFEKRGRFYLLKFGLSNSSFWTIGLKIVSSLSRIWGSDIGW